MLYPKDLVDIVLGAVHVSKNTFWGSTKRPGTPKALIEST